jgi:hypothetical protein
MTGICGVNPPRRFVRARAGESLVDFARRVWPADHGTTAVENLLAWNPRLKTTGTLAADQVIFVVGPSSSPAENSSPIPLS